MLYRAGRDLSSGPVEPYRLYYWPSIQGRGEFIRLALEEAGAPYVDVARLPAKKGGGERAILHLLDGKIGGVLGYAPPILADGERYLSQTANILLYLGPRHGLTPGDEVGRLHANQLQLTIADLVTEAHNTHHPIAVGLYYEDQKPEALAAARAFLGERLPRFLGHFERVRKESAAAGSAWMIGERLSYVDLSMFQVLEGLRYAFPRAFAARARSWPHLLELRDRVAARPNIAAYLASPRRIAWNESGIFRHYPELDLTR